MIKKIAVKDVRLGMFVHELCGNWLDHPFWKTKFKLESPADLLALKNSPVQEIMIDIAKGLDVEVSPAPRPAQAVVEAPAPAQESRPVSLADELKQAQKIKSRARAVVAELFQEARMGHTLDLMEANAVIEDIDASLERNHNALVSLVRLKSKDDYTYLHSVAVGTLMVALGKQLKLDAALRRDLGLAGLLHDLGKMAIPVEILNKPGRLTDAEFEIIKKHPAIGAAILEKAATIPALAIDVCRHHHERVDGRGYPDGQSGDALSLYARMGAICDVYDAITSARSYKEAWDPSDAIRRMASWKDGQFDPEIFSQFVRLIGIYPVGTLVQLKSRRLGVVVAQTAESLLKPVVRIFYSTLSMSRIPLEDINLSRSREEVGQVEDVSKWTFDLPAIMEA
jgi:putative nucleotidyltransferase with HDIG domain